VTDAGFQIVLRRDRFVVLAALMTVTVLAWAYVLHLARQMNMGSMDMNGFRMAVTAAGMVMTPAFQSWSGSEFLFTVAMWVVMMIGMMTPSAAPIILLYARVGRQASLRGKPFAATTWFMSGYLLAWIGFSVVAAVSQWGLDRAAMLTPGMAGASVMFGGIVLIASGAYQWSSFKDRCLIQCQSPIQFIHDQGGFRRSRSGSLRLGMSHGAFCVGCCWALMALLFVGGVMNVLWIALIAILVLAEKVIPTRRLVSRFAGLTLVIAGVWLLLSRPH
jgi:predicted metal-binding membrane protein